MRTKEDVLNDLKKQGYELSEHPEGGYYIETKRSDQMVTIGNGGNQGKMREAYTTIYFLLEKSDFSAFHRIDSDETWNFVEGAPINLYLLDPATKKLSKVKISSFSDGGIPMYTVPRNIWFAAEIDKTKSDYSLATCSVAPAFCFEGFELAKRNYLLKEYSSSNKPDYAEVITQLTRE